jgi:signal peptidase I
LFINKRSVGKAIVWFLVILMVSGIWTGSLISLTSLAQQQLFSAGVVDTPTVFATQGPSMLPTLKEEDEVLLSNPAKVGISRGDIVTFSNTETDGSGYVKRVVGLPGETLSIRNGVVWVGDRALIEPYTYLQKPTYGNTFLGECEAKTIPDGYVAVMGDNRAVSWDSRAIGWVATSDIDGVRKEQEPVLQSTPPDIRQAEEFNEKEFLRLLNEKRTANKIGPVITHAEITSAAMTRAKTIDQQFVAWKQNKTSVEDDLNAAGYRTNAVHEYVVFGALSAADALEQIVGDPDEKDMFLSGQFTEIGMGVVTRQDGVCSYPIRVVVLSWPALATYDADVVAFWKKEAKTLNENLQDYQRWVGFSNLDQAKLKSLIQLTSQMVLTADRLSRKMVAREWLNSGDYAASREYKTLVDRHNAMREELFETRTTVRGMSVEEPIVAW